MSLGLSGGGGGGGVRGGGCGGGGGGPILVGFFGYPRSGAGKTIVAKGACFGLDLGFFGKCISETFEGEAGPP